MNTMHSIIRADERAGMKPGAAARFTDLAIRNGRKAEELPSRERRYLESKEQTPGFTAVLYNGFIFIMKDEELCITMFMAPNWFLKRRHFDGKKKVRDPKKYLRYRNTCGTRAEADC